MKFDFSKYKGKYVMHCHIEELADDFCKVMHDEGMAWIDGMLYKKNKNWSIYKDKTVYYFNEGKFGKYDDAKREGYTILYWEDFIQKEFRKADLRDGMVGITRNGTRYIFLNGFFMNANQVEHLCYPERMNDDLTIRNVPSCDIMRICKSKARIFKEYFADDHLETIWQRHEEVTEMTVSEIKTALGIPGTLKIKEG